MTPWQLKCCGEGHKVRQIYEHNEAATMMYYNAVLTRSQKRLPDIKKFLILDSKSSSGKKPSQRIDENAILARMKKYKREFSSGKSSKSSG